MLNNILGKKIGMTQLFDKNGNVVPVTVVNINNWVVTQIKTSEKDGYTSLQLGLLKNKYQDQTFSNEWLGAKQDHFLHLKEVHTGAPADYSVGQPVSITTVALQEGDVVSVTGQCKGLGFQGVVKRWGFSGGPSSHGSKFHRKPGSGGHLRRQGEVIKGKRFPGHAGTEQITVKGLKIIRIDREAGCLFIKGAIPGKKDTLIAIKKQGI